MSYVIQKQPNRRGKQLISLDDTGLLNRKIQFSGGMGRVDYEANTKAQGSKYKMTYIRLHTHVYTNKYPRFSIVLPLIVSRSPKVLTYSLMQR